MKILLVEGREDVLSRGTQRQKLVDRNVSAMFGDDLWLSGKSPACIAGDSGSTLGSGRSPGGGHGNPL